MSNCWELDLACDLGWMPAEYYALVRKVWWFMDRAFISHGTVLRYLGLPDPWEGVIP